MLIRLISIGEVDKNIISAVLSDISGVYSLRARFLGSITPPHEAYNQWRKQWDAEKILEKLSNTSGKHIDQTIPCIGITELDIYYNKLNFVFALEDPFEGTGIISIARLREEFYDNPPNFTKLVERTIKEILHVLGHLLGLEHCSKEFCVMAFSPSVNDIDKKEMRYCDSCILKLTTKGINIEK